MIGPVVCATVVAALLEDRWAIDERLLASDGRVLGAVGLRNRILVVVTPLDGHGAVIVPSPRSCRVDRVGARGNVPEMGKMSGRVNDLEGRVNWLDCGAATGWVA